MSEKPKSTLAVRAPYVGMDVVAMTDDRCEYYAVIIVVHPKWEPGEPVLVVLPGTLPGGPKRVVFDWSPTGEPGHCYPLQPGMKLAHHMHSLQELKGDGARIIVPDEEGEPPPDSGPLT